MEKSITELFVILALSPDKGRISANNLHFKYTLTGALFMDFLLQGEMVTEKKRVIPSFRMNGETIHDSIAERIMRARKNRRISFWISRFSGKSKAVFNNTIQLLEAEGMIRIEKRKFLNIIPFYRYWFNNTKERTGIIEKLRGILLYSKLPDKKDLMLLGLVDAAKIYKQLARENSEIKPMRKKNSELLKGDVLSAEISQAIREVQAAVMTSITAANAAHGAH